jgi:transcription elongation GreA/GreB family factor
VENKAKKSGVHHSGIDKEKLLREVIAQVEETLRRLGSGYAVARQATLDSPHVMKSKREVTGIEASYLANALAGNIQEREFWLRTLKQVRLPDAPQRAALGCVVGIGRPEGPVERLYFILPVCGGLEVFLEGEMKSVRVVTPETPVAKALIGRSVGDEVKLQQRQDALHTVHMII